MRVADPVRSSQAESAGIKAYPQRKKDTTAKRKEEMKDQKECRRTTLFSPSRLRRAIATARANPHSSERIIARADP